MNKDTFFLDTIAKLMQEHGGLNKKTLQLIEQDQPKPGDRMYQFKDSAAKNSWRIFFKKKDMASNEFQSELFTQSENGAWQKSTDGG